MFKSIDLYLGVFLLLCGFGISLVNLRNLVANKNKFSTILLSENILIMCIGIAFLFRAVHELNPENIGMGETEMELRLAGLNFSHSPSMASKCGFVSLLLSYGPLVVSLVNSFLSLVIDNYMHYRMLADIKKKDEQDIVREIGESSRSFRKIESNKFWVFWKKNFSILTISVQWIIPILIALFMYPMEVKEMRVYELRSLDSCMAMLNLDNNNCDNYNATKFDNLTELRKYIPTNYLEVDKEVTNSTTKVDSVLENVLDIIKNFNNNTDFAYTNIKKSLRRPKNNDKCTKICFTDNKNMLLYMFVLAFLSYFVPITISTIILTKIHIMQVNRPNAKTYVTRELLYNILFWTPVMFDTFLSLVMCTFTMNGVRTSLFNVIANVYQAVKNFMNTRYFKDTVIVPS